MGANRNAPRDRTVPVHWTTICGFVFALFLYPHVALAQEIGLGGLHGSSNRSDMPGGPGFKGWVAITPFEFVRLQAGVAREWGRRSQPGTMCDLYWPDRINCVAETVEDQNTVTTLELAAVLLSPQLSGFRLGVGYGLARQRFDVSRRGVQTGRTERPVEGADDALRGGSWLVIAERAGVLHDRVRLEAGLQRFGVEFTGCVMDAWGLCGDGTLTRYWLGLGYRIR